jgi:REP element-mobilizing transposase RayT
VEGIFLKRKTIRLKEYDYSQSGYYFVTICTQNRQKILCDILDENCRGGCLQPPLIQLSETGKIVEKYLNNINIVYDNIHLDSFVIMPNHIHCIIIIDCKHEQTEVSRQPLESGGCGQPPLLQDDLSLSNVINSFKTITSKKNKNPFWQRSFYDHIIRNEKDLKNIREYILNNPLKWELDKYYIK